MAFGSASNVQSPAVLKKSDGAQNVGYGSDTVASKLDDIQDNTVDTNGASIVGYKSSDSGSSSIDVHAKLSDLRSVTDFGLTPSGTDDTSSLTTFLASLSASDDKFYIIPAGFKFNRNTVINAMPEGTAFLDLSGYDYDAPAETTRRYGIMSKDSAPNDTHWAVDSGHHAIMTLNNHGLSGTASADERKGSILWATGNLQNSGNTKRGFREAALLQFTQSTSSNFWVFQLRKTAPWNAIDNNWEDWQAGESISGAGIYRRGQDNFYVSTGTGTTGATIPSHTSGTVSDGGVSWTWFCSSDSSIFNIDEHNRLLFGSGAFSQTFRHKVSITDPNGGGYSSERVATGVSRPVTDKLIPTDSGGSEIAVPYLQADDTNELQIMKSNGGTGICQFGDDIGVKLKENARFWIAASDGDSTPSVDGVATLYTANSSSTSITTLDDADDGQVVDIVITDTNTTLVSSASFLLDGSVNLTTPTPYTVVTMQKVPSSISDRWVEVSRSVK